MRLPPRANGARSRALPAATSSRYPRYAATRPPEFVSRVDESPPLDFRPLSRRHASLCASPPKC